MSTSASVSALHFERTKDPVTGEYYYRTLSAEEKAAMERLAAMSSRVAVAERRVVLAAKAVRARELAWAVALVGDDAVLANKTASMLAADKELEAAVDALLELEAAQ